jgi:hypothetical protein
LLFKHRSAAQLEVYTEVIRPHPVAELSKDKDCLNFTVRVRLGSPSRPCDEATSEPERAGDAKRIAS